MEQPGFGAAFLWYSSTFLQSTMRKRVGLVQYRFTDCTDLNEDSGGSGANLPDIELPELLVDEDERDEGNRDDPWLVVDRAQAQNFVDHCGGKKAKKNVAISQISSMNSRKCIL